MVPFRRGAWLRLYDIPIHAWDENFFKLCVMDCGTFLRSDDMKLDRGRLDFARVLISISSFEIVSRVDKLSIDGQLVEIKITNEWGFNIGEDVCLFEDDEDQKSQSDFVEGHGDPKSCKNVDTLIDKIMQELMEEDANSDIEARDVIRIDDVIETTVRAVLSVLGSQTQPDKVVDMATSQCLPLAAVSRPVCNDVDVAADDGNMLQNDDISTQVKQFDFVSNLNGGKGKQAAVLK